MSAPACTNRHTHCTYWLLLQSVENEQDLGRRSWLLLLLFSFFFLLLLNLGYYFLDFFNLQILSPERQYIVHSYALHTMGILLP